MKTFEQFLEAYGFGNPEEEKLDAELYGIGETLKNALASGNLAYQWGTLGERIRNLEKLGVDARKLRQVITYYRELTNDITRTYRELRDVDRGEPHVHNTNPIDSKYSQETVGQRVQHTLAGVSKIALIIRQDLRSMGHASLGM